MCFLATRKVGECSSKVQIIKGSFLSRNSWSDEGVSTIRDGNGVKCEATHLTSFAVLVDVQGTGSSSTPTVSLNDFFINVASHFRPSLSSATLAVAYQ